MAAERKLRHTCEQDEVQRYGYTEHDGETYASQPIVDRENGLELQTSFVKPDGREAAGAWAARIEGKLLPGESQGAPQTVIFYLGIDGDAGGASRLSVARERPAFTPGAGAHVSGEVDGVGRFSLLAEGRSSAGGARSDDDAETCEAERGPSLQPHCWGGTGAQATYLHVRDIAGRELLASAELRLSDAVPEDSQLLLVQFVATPPFTLDFVYVPGGPRLTHPHTRTSSRTPPHPPRPHAPHPHPPHTPTSHPAPRITAAQITAPRRARSPCCARHAHRPRSGYRGTASPPVAPPPSPPLRPHAPELRRRTGRARWVRGRGRGRGVQGRVHGALRPPAECRARAPARRLRGGRSARLRPRHRAAGRRAALPCDEALRGSGTGRAARVARLLLRHDLGGRARRPRDRRRSSGSNTPRPRP